jgi:hypothetical protein
MPDITLLNLTIFSRMWDMYLLSIALQIVRFIITREYLYKRINTFKYWN